MPDAVDSRCDAGEKVRVAQVGRGLWGTYTEAQAAADRGGFSGVGVMLSGGLVGIDMDGVVGEGGKIEPWAQKVVDEIGSYAEISPSGTGVHVIARADPSVVGAIGRANHAKGLEVYNHSRFFTVTGRQIAGKGIADATGGVAKLLADEFPSESGEDRLRRAVGRMARDQVGRRANRAVAHNAERDGVRYARVPQGGETCEFCAMLASRGFVYTSTKTAGELKHYHVGCRCKVVPEPKDGLDVEGYDPDEWYSRWKDLESSLVSDEKPDPDGLWGRYMAAKEVDHDHGLTFSEKIAKKAVLAIGLIDSALAKFSKIKGEPSVVEATRHSNRLDRFKAGDWGYMNNCQRCVVASELRRKGFDVVAKASLDGADMVADHWRDLFRDCDWIRVSDRKSADAEISRMPVGSRGSVYIVWKPDAKGKDHAHLFNFERTDNKIIYYDVQRGDVDVSWYFHWKNENYPLEIARTDNLIVNTRFIDRVVEGADRS